MKLSDLIAESAMTWPRRVEDFINQNFYVFDDKKSGDDEIDYIIEESKAKYRIGAWGDGGVNVWPDIGSGATQKRANEIKRTLLKINTMPSVPSPEAEFTPQFIRGVYDGTIDLYDAMKENTASGRATARLFDELSAKHPGASEQELFDMMFDIIMQKAPQ